MTTTFPSGHSPSTGCCTATDNWRIYPVDQRAAFTATNHLEFENLSGKVQNASNRLRDWYDCLADELKPDENDTESYNAMEVRAYVRSALEYCLISCSNEMGDEVAGNLLDIDFGQQAGDYQQTLSDSTQWKAANLVKEADITEMPMLLAYLLTQFAEETAVQTLDNAEQLARVNLMHRQQMEAGEFCAPMARIAKEAADLTAELLATTTFAFAKLYRGEVK